MGFRRKSSAPHGLDDRFARRLAAVHKAIVEAGQTVEPDNGAVGDSAGHEQSGQTGKDDLPNDAIRPLEDLLALIEQVRRNGSPTSPDDSLGIESVSETPRALDETADDVFDGSPLDTNDNPVESHNEASTTPQDLERSSTRAVLGRFDIHSLLGRGGFGMVYSALDRKLGRRVAIKIPRPEAMLSPALRRRFLREGRAAASLSHPNIVTIYEAGQEGPICYLASELVNGSNLVDWRQRMPFDPMAIGRIMEKTAEAIQHAHSRGVLHRDLKPANILMAGDSPRVTDFGLALQLEDLSLSSTADAIVGTPAFMAPEQAMGGRDRIDVRTDVYGLGTILYFLLAGVPPFSGQTLMETLNSVRERDPLPPRKHNPQVPIDLESICLKCIDKSPDRRYASAYELQLDLQRFLAGDPVMARPITVGQRFARWYRRNPALAITSVAAGLFLMVSLAATTIGWYGTSTALAREQQANGRAAQRLEQLQSKSRELTGAIDRLFVSLATSSEVQRESAEELRRTLLAEANHFYQLLLAEQPDDDAVRMEHARTLYHLAEIHELLGDLGEALTIGKQALEQAGQLRSLSIPNDELGGWHVFLARCLYKLGMFDEAKTEFEQALALIDLNGQHEDELHCLPERAGLLTFRADQLLIEGKLEQARGLAEEVDQLWKRIDVRRSPHDCDVSNLQFERAMSAFVIAEFLQMTGKLADAESRYNQALERFASANRRFPDSSGIVFNWCRCLRGHGIALALQEKYGRARDCYAAALEMLDPLVLKHPLIEVYARLACSIRYSLSATEASVQDWDTVEALLLVNISSLQELAERFPESRATTFSSLGDHFNLLSVAWSESKMRLPAEAEEALRQSIDWFEQAIAANPDWTRPQMALARAEDNLGSRCLDRGDLHDAEHWKQRALVHNERLLESQPYWREARISHGHILAGMVKVRCEQGRWNEALEFGNRLLELDSDHPQSNRVRVEQARLLALLGDPASARNRIEEFYNEYARQDDDFIHAARTAMVIAVELDKDRRSTDHRFNLKGTESDVSEGYDPLSDSQSAIPFQNLALEIIRRGAELTSSSRDDFLDRIRGIECLSGLVRELDD